MGKTPVTPTMPIKWSEEWSVGNDLIDLQHQQLVSLLNRIIKAENRLKILTGSEALKKEVGDTISWLIKYTETHFRDEEEILSHYSYPELEAHKKTHQNLINQLLTLEEKYKTHEEEVLPILTGFLSKWLYDHIMKVDKRFTKYISRRDIPER